MRKRFVMNLQLFDDGGQGGAGNSAGTAGNGNGGQTASTGATYSFEQAEQIANARADHASRAALANYFKQQGMTEDQVTQAIADFKTRQQAQQPNVEAIQKERDEAKAALENYKHREFLTSKGVGKEYLDFVSFEISKKVDDKTTFEKAAEAYLKDNPRYAGHGNYRVSSGTQPGGSGTAQDTNDTINSSIRQAFGR